MDYYFKCIVKDVAALVLVIMILIIFSIKMFVGFQTRQTLMNSILQTEKTTMVTNDKQSNPVAVPKTSVTGADTTIIMDANGKPLATVTAPKTQSTQPLLGVINVGDRVYVSGKANYTGIEYIANCYGTVEYPGIKSMIIKLDSLNGDGPATAIVENKYIHLLNNKID